MLDSKLSGLAYRGDQVHAKYGNPALRWGEDPKEKVLSTKDGREERRQALQKALDERQEGSTIRDFNTERVYFERDGKKLGIRYETKEDEVALGREYETQL